MQSYAKTSSAVQVANKIKKAANVTMPRLVHWNYGPCPHHETPNPKCEYRMCGNDFFAHQRVSIMWLYAIKKGLVASSPGTGKAQPVWAKVLTPQGWREIGSLQPGDEVYTPSRDITRVKSRHPQGIQPIYRIHMNFGEITHATPEHLWKVGQGTDEYQIMTTQQIKDSLPARPMLHTPPIYDPKKKWLRKKYFKQIEEAGWEECICIALESEEQLYITDDYIITHNTNVILGLLCLLKEKNEIPRRSVIVVNTPSVKQWEAEAKRFAPGLKVAAIPGGTKKKERVELYGGSWDVLIIGYHLMLRDLELIKKIKPSALLTDDVDPILNETKVHRAIVELSEDVDRVVVSNASSIATDLLQIYNSMKPIGGKYIWGPKQVFEDNFVQKDWQRIKVGTQITTDDQGRRVMKPKYVNQSKVRGVNNGKVFRDTLDPWYIRYTYDDINDVAMPSVAPITNVWLDMHPEQRKRYTELRNGVLKLMKESGEREIKEVQALQMFAQPLDSKVLTPTGWTTIGEIKVGDEVLTPEGFTAPVSGKSVVRKAPVYRVSTTNGGQTLASGDHLWEVSWRSVSGSTKKEKYLTKVMSTEEILEKGVLFSSPSLKNIRKRRFNLPSPSLFTPDVSLPVPAYTLGALLGDGRTGKHSSVSLTGNDLEIKERVMKELGTSFCYSFGKQDGVWHYSMRIATLDGRTSRKPNPLTTYFRSVGLNVGATDKFIPEEYLHAGWQQRVDLLRGLMDTDGCAYQTNFVTASKRLADDVSALVRSLGGRAAIYTYAENKYTVDVNIHVNPFFLKRKASKWKPPHSAGIKIDSIEYVGEMDVQCIMVDSERHLYITDDYIVTHNTYGQQITAGLPVLGEEDGPGKSIKFDWLCAKMRTDWKDEKVICFVRNKKAIRALEARFDGLGIGYAEVSGNKVGEERQAEITRFWEDPNCKVIFCSAAGVRSLNLQCARIVCFLDIPSLNPESVHQAIGRARRTGGHDIVYPFFLFCNDTQEDHYEEVLQQRETISRWVWDSEDHLLPKMSSNEIMKLILP